ncbi:ATP-binding cassette domain-containing protein [Candidatus Woesearchaeota archaeon]|nr:ATP-binding cassette domain-containing protein [Candidatus Woesearchaeota archaeon]
MVYSISVRDLTKNFNGFTAVNRISFSVKKGEIFAFLGPNGAGKTTTIKILTTLLRPSGGSVHVNGYSLKDKDRIRQSFGIVFQDPSLDDELTAYENMVFHAIFYAVPKKVYAKRIEELLKFVELWDRKDSRVKTFSGGMKRRLEIARGLIHHPKILFLDEPTLGLDAQTRNLVLNHVREINKKEGMTVFLTTHYLDEAEKIADTIAIIDHGVLVAKGSLSSLLKKTEKKTLEAAYLKLTGTSIRNDQASSLEHLRTRMRVWKK